MVQVNTVKVKENKIHDCSNMAHVHRTKNITVKSKHVFYYFFYMS
jgi:hypothetical protein